MGQQGAKIPADSTGGQKAGSPSELAWISGYFSEEQAPKRFDGFGRDNDHGKDHFDHMVHPETARTRACVSVEWVAFSEIAQDIPMTYVPCGISSGLRVHEELDKKNRSNAQVPDYEPERSSYKANEALGSDIHGRVMELNKGDTMRRGRIISRMRPDAMIILPPIREGSVRALKDHAFAGGQRYEEEEFMALWYPVIDRCRDMCLDGDWNFSRNSIWEMMRGVLIQAGQLPSRPKADMEVFDLQGHPVSLLQRTEKVIEMLKYQLGKGFEAREAASALAQIFSLDDDIRACKVPGEGASLHPVLKHRPPEELKAMDALKEQFKPIILAHCAHYMRLDDLPAEYHAAVKRKPRALTKEQQAYFKAFADDVSGRQYEILSVKPSRGQMATLADKGQPPQRMYDSHERFFEKRAQARMFEDDLYGKLSEWERLALPFAIGATEIGLYPVDHPMATMVLTDLKRGKEGFARAQQIGVQDMNEFAGAMGRDTAEVISHNMQQAEALKAELKKAHPGTVIVNTLSFLRIADTIEHFRKFGEPGKRSQRFIAADGATETSPQMRLALQMKYLDRNVDRAVFQEGWEHSNDLVQLRVRARLIQAGLIERPAGAQAGMHVFSAADPNTPETLLEDITLLTKEVERAAAANVRAPEQALALMRLIALHELLVAPSLQETGHKTTREVINPLTADESLTCYDRQEARTITEEAKTVLKEKAVLWIPRERMEARIDANDDPDRAAAKMVQDRRMEDYLKAQDRLIGEQDRMKQPTRHDEIHITAKGAQR